MIVSWAWVGGVGGASRPTRSNAFKNLPTLTLNLKKTLADKERPMSISVIQKPTDKTLAPLMSCDVVENSFEKYRVRSLSEKVF